MVYNMYYNGYVVIIVRETKLKVLFEKNNKY